MEMRNICWLRWIRLSWVVFNPLGVHQILVAIFWLVPFQSTRATWKRGATSVSLTKFLMSPFHRCVSKVQHSDFFGPSREHLSQQISHTSTRPSETWHHHSHIYTTNSSLSFRLKKKRLWSSLIQRPNKSGTITSWGVNLVLSLFKRVMRFVGKYRRKQAWTTRGAATI